MKVPDTETLEPPDPVAGLPLESLDTLGPRKIQQPQVRHHAQGAGELAPVSGLGTVELRVGRGSPAHSPQPRPSARPPRLGECNRGQLGLNFLDPDLLEVDEP